MSLAAWFVAAFQLGLPIATLLASAYLPGIHPAHKEQTLHSVSDLLKKRGRR
jgi:hypothetical protein